MNLLSFGVMGKGIGINTENFIETMTYLLLYTMMAQGFGINMVKDIEKPMQQSFMLMALKNIG
jgi:hypothetical protein